MCDCFFGIFPDSRSVFMVLKVPGRFFKVRCWFFIVPGGFNGFSRFKVVFFSSHVQVFFWGFSQGFRLVFHGSRLFFHGFRSVLMVFHGPRWVSMVPGRFSWFQVGFSWFQVGFHGFSWFKVGFS